MQLPFPFERQFSFKSVKANSAPHAAESNDEKEKSIQGEKNASVVDSTSQEVARTHELTGIISCQYLNIKYLEA